MLRRRYSGFSVLGKSQLGALPLKIILVSLGVMLVATGCSIKQHVEPAEVSEDAKVCIVENTDVREGFLIEFTKILDEKEGNYTITDIETARECEWKVTYTARWSWDLALYMSYAEINVYRYGVLDGQAVYDATMGGGRLDKFIDSEPKIRELVEELMQKERAWLAPAIRKQMYSAT